MASLPSVANASYWQYKEDTSYVLKWIDQTAKTCGWKRQQAKQTVPASSSSGSQKTNSNKGIGISTNESASTNMKAGSGRLKGKDRKAAKQQAAAAAAVAIEKTKRDEDERGVVLSALEILEQANLISTCPPSKATRPPVSVLHALGRTIKLRKRFSDWFEVTRPDDHKSNSAHHYFLKVLEEIADLFLQATGKASVSLDEVNTGHASSGASRAGKQNRYESLLEQAIQDEPESSTAQSARSSEPAIKEEPITSGRKYHIEIKDSQENAFMVFTLFTDLQDIKAEMKRLWERCFKDGADMVIATTLTAQALAFVQRSEERIMPVLDDTSRQKVDSEQEGIGNNAWSFPGTYCRLLSTLLDPDDVQAVLHFENANHTTGNKGEAVNMNDLTFAFSARRLSYFSRPWKTTYCQPLFLQFEHNPRALLNADLAKVLERDSSLCCTFTELANRGYVPPSQEHYQGYPEDEIRLDSIRMDPILNSLHPVWVRQEVNLTGVFAAEVMLDIKEISDAFPASRPSYDIIYNRYMNLLGLKSNKEERVLDHTLESPLVRGAGSDGWESKVAEIMTKVIYMLPDRSEPNGNRPWQEQFDVGCAEALELYAGLDPLYLDYGKYRQGRLFKFIWLPKNINYLLDNYPMFSTFRQAFMEALTESVGIEIFNADRHGLGAMAYVYNASRQLGLGNLHWPAMDRLIDLHTVALFAGDVPTTPAAMLKSFSHRYWGPKGRMSRKEKRRRMNRAIAMMKPSAVTQAYNEHYDTAGRIPYWYTLESNALAAAAENKAGKNSVLVNTSFIENIPVIEEYLMKQLQDVRVDYMEIDRLRVDFNKSLLKHARAKFETQGNRILREEVTDLWSGINFVSESFEQEAQLHEAMSKCGGDPSKLPIQDCDYLQDSINCLAAAVRANGIGKDQVSTDGEPVNMATSLTRFRIRGSDDLPDMRRLVLVSHCSCCHRKHYF